MKRLKKEWIKVISRGYFFLKDIKTPHNRINPIPKKVLFEGNWSPKTTPKIIEKIILLYPIADTSPLLPKLKAFVK